MERQEEILNSVQALGAIINPVPSTFLMPDESDRIFYDTAKACEGYLVTGNSKHFPADDPFIMTPARFIEILRKWVM